MPYLTKFLHVYKFVTIYVLMLWWNLLKLFKCIILLSFLINCTYMKPNNSLIVRPCLFAHVTTGIVNWRWWNTWWRTLTSISTQQIIRIKLLLTMLEDGTSTYYILPYALISVFSDMLYDREVLSATVHEHVQVQISPSIVWREHYNCFTLCIYIMMW